MPTSVSRQIFKFILPFLDKKLVFVAIIIGLAQGVAQGMAKGVAQGVASYFS